MRFSRLLPDPAPVELAELLRDLRLGDRARPDRPYLVANLAATADGKVAVGGSSDPIGDEGDREMFFGLRGVVDAVLAGTGTLAAEHYGPLAGRPERQAARRAAGLAAHPLLVTVTRSGRVPEVPLLADADSSFVIYTGRATAPAVGAASVRVIDLSPPALGDAVAHLRTELGVRSVLCEGGPTLLGALLAENLVDELFLTVAPRLAGGEAPGVTAGPPLPALRTLDLRWVLERQGSLFVRYAFGRGGN